MDRMACDLTYDQIQDWFAIGKAVKIETVPKTKLHGRLLDPTTGGPAPYAEPTFIHGGRRFARLANQTEYASHYRELDEESRFNQMRLDSEVAESTIMTESVMDHLDDSISQCTRGCRRLADIAVDLPEGQTEEEALQVYRTYNFAHTFDPKLPITKFKEDIVDMIESTQVTIIQGETGSGKTTQVAQYILDHYQSKNRYCNIVVTQPRRIAAISIAKRVCSERNWVCGRLCGYQIGMEKEASEDTRLLYCTTGVLLAKLVKEKSMRQYTHVILDEVHERDEDSDFCLLVVKKFLNSNSRDVKVVLMSATFDTDLFAHYFSHLVGNQLEPAPILTVEGRSYEVAEYYLDDLDVIGASAGMINYDEGPALPRSILELAGRLVLRFDQLEDNRNANDERGSVLMFLPGLPDIEDMDSILWPHRLTHKLKIIALHSTVTGDEQASVFKKVDVGCRKVILSTNIAESSITIPDIRYVIDFCLTKTNICDQITNYTSLQLQWASQANCTQRKGRAGRVANGRVYRLVTNKFFREQIPEYSIPEMQRCPLDHLVLQTKILDIGEPKAILALALSPPQLDDIERTILSLKEIGALSTLSGGELNPHDGTLTFLGRVLASLPVDVRMGKLMMLGHVFGLLEECIIICGSTSQRSFFAKPFKSSFMSYSFILQWAGDSFSDSIAYINAYKEWQKQRDIGRFHTNADERKWCEDNWIQIRRIKDTERLVEELRKRLSRFNIITPKGPLYRSPDLDNMETRLVLKLVMCGAFYPYYFQQDSVDPAIASRELSGHNPCTTVMVKGLPANQGTRYRAQLEKMFAWCDDHRQPHIHFEATKAFIEFVRDPTEKQSANKIVPAVMKAIKMRQGRDAIQRMSIDLIVDDRTRSIEDSQSDHSVPSLSSVAASVSQSVKEPHQVELPSPAQKHIEILIPDVIECGHFWATYQYDFSHPNQQNLIRQSQLIQQSVLEQQCHKQMNPDFFSVGSYCLAPYQDAGEPHPTYYRARIQKKIRTAAEVFFVDYGNISTVPLGELRQMHSTFFHLPFQAFECELSGIRPSVIKCPSGQWTREAKEKFHSLVRQASKIIAEVYSIVHNVVRVELIVNIGGTDVLVNQELIQQNYADKAEESYLSNLNRIQRDQFSDTIHRRSATRSGESAAESMTSASDLHSVCREKETTEENSGYSKASCVRGGKIILHGPSSPYEVRYTCCTNMGKLRPTRVSQDSINSVSLNTEPSSELRRMMVAANIVQNPNSTTISARDTTLLPTIPGLLSLISLVFTPIAELRVDRKRRIYTGALCGLGWDNLSMNGCAALPDNDMEIAFDVRLDENDIKLINQIRIAINLGIGSEEKMATWSQDAVVKIQREAHNILLELIKRRRDVIEPIYFENQYRWCQIDTALLNYPVMDSHADNILFHLHPLPELIHETSVPTPIASGAMAAVPRQTNRVMSHIERLSHQRELEQIASTGSTELKDIQCQLCNRTVHSAKDLAMHIRTVVHRQNQPLV